MMDFAVGLRYDHARATKADFTIPVICYFIHVLGFSTVRQGGVLACDGFRLEFNNTPVRWGLVPSTD